MYQCKQAQCSGGSACIFELNKRTAPHAQTATTRRTTTCDQGECRGWYIVGYQSAPLTAAEENSGGDLELVQSGNESFNLQRVAQLKEGRTIVDLALVYPGTLFSMQVWSQESLPWERLVSEGL